MYQKCVLAYRTHTKTMQNILDCELLILHESISVSEMQKPIKHRQGWVRNLRTQFIFAFKPTVGFVALKKVWHIFLEVFLFFFNSIKSITLTSYPIL